MPSRPTVWTVTEDATGESRGALAEDPYRAVFEHSNDAIMIVDFEDDAFVEVNPAACELLEYTRAELLSLHPGDVHPDDMDRVREEFVDQVLAEGSGFTTEMTCVTKSGEEVPTEASGAALAPAEGDPTRMVAMLRDVSERAANRRELERTVERLDRFASVVSHDLKNPLAAVRAEIELALETGDDDHLEAALGQVDRADELVDRVLELAHDGTAVDPEDRTRVDLDRVAREAWVCVDGDAATLAVEGTPSVEADPDRLREALENLFENAATHAGTDVTVRVGALGADSGDDVRGFYVEDDGPGVPPEERDRVFEWGHTGADDGTGLGLAIVESIVEAHGWSVRVAESETGGARFEVETRT